MSARSRSSAWRKRMLREKLFMKQGGFCYYCLEPMDMGAPHGHPRRGTLDHVRPRAKGGRNTQDNIVLACTSCNNQKGALPEVTFRKKRRASQIADNCGQRG